MRTSLAALVAVPPLLIGLVACQAPTDNTSASSAPLGTPSASSSTLLHPATPDPNSVTGAVAPGMPAVLTALPEGAVILLSSAKPQDDQLQVAASFTSQMSIDDLVAWYDQQLGAAGFTPTDPTTPAPEGARVRVYLRGGGAEYLSLTIVDQGTERDATIGGLMNPDAPTS